MIVCFGTGLHVAAQRAKRAVRPSIKQDAGTVVGHNFAHVLQNAIEHFVKVQRAAQCGGCIAQCFGQGALFTLGGFGPLAIGDVGQNGDRAGGLTVFVIQGGA